MQIKQLEGELGAQLFERIGKQVKLTQAGERLLPYALEILDCRPAGEKHRPGAGGHIGEAAHWHMRIASSTAFCPR